MLRYTSECTLARSGQNASIRTAVDASMSAVQEPKPIGVAGGTVTTAVLEPAGPTVKSADAPRPGRGRRAPRANAGLGLTGLLGVALLAEALPRLGVVNPQLLPPVTQMIAVLGDQVHSREFWKALLATLRGWSIGLTIAMVGGVVCGTVVGSVRVIRIATASTIEFLRPIPSVALIPLAVLIFGTSMKSTLLLVIYASFWPVLLQVLSGIQDVDPVARETARCYRFGQLTQVRTVVWPTALPFIMTGLRLAAAVALVLEVTGELIIGSPGLGQMIAVAQTAGAVETMYALVLVTGIIGVSVNVVVRAVERRALRWHPSVRREVV
jgi:ABC-type nitrate/sulfonate/bicarbonate transport system permease component